MALVEVPKEFPTQLFINGEFKDAADGRTFDNINPATEDVIAKIAMAGKADLEAAIEAAKQAQPAWGAAPPQLTQTSWAPLTEPDRTAT